MLGWALHLGASFFWGNCVFPTNDGNHHGKTKKKKERERAREREREREKKNVRKKIPGKIRDQELQKSNTAISGKSAGCTRRVNKQMALLPYLENSVRGKERNSVTFDISLWHPLLPPPNAHCSLIFSWLHERPHTETEQKNKNFPCSNFPAFFVLSQFPNFTAVSLSHLCSHFLGSFDFSWNFIWTGNSVEDRRNGNWRRRNATNAPRTQKLPESGSVSRGSMPNFPPSVLRVQRQQDAWKKRETKKGKFFSPNQYFLKKNCKEKQA